MKRFYLSILLICCAFIIPYHVDASSYSAEQFVSLSGLFTVGSLNSSSQGSLALADVTYFEEMESFISGSASSSISKWSVGVGALYRYDAANATSPITGSSDVRAGAEFTQTFIVTSEGTASISFEQNGVVESWHQNGDPSNPNNFPLWGRYTVQGNTFSTDFLIDGVLDGTQGGWGWTQLVTDNEQAGDRSGKYTINLNFGTQHIGKEFDFKLVAGVWVSDRAAALPGEIAVLGFNFGNTAEITAVTGVISPKQYPNPIPEPSTMMLLGIGMIGLFHTARKKLFEK